MNEPTEYALIAAAAGRGIRLRNLSGETPKPLVDVAGKPILRWALERFTDPAPARVAVVASPDWVEASTRLAQEIFYSAEVMGVAQREPLGTFDALRKAMVELEVARQPVVFLHGDNIPPAGLLGDVMPHLGERDAVVFSRISSNPGTSARIMRDLEGQPTGLGRAQPGTGATEIMGGLFVFGAWVWDRFGHAQPQRQGEWRIDSLIDELMRADRARVIRVDEPWLHINTVEDYRQAESRLHNAQ